MSPELGTEVKGTREKQWVLQTWNKLSDFKIQNIDLHELILQRSFGILEYDKITEKRNESPEVLYWQ